MNSTSTQPTTQVVNVEILHLDELGYGPEGKHTRREWREACLTHLLAGNNVFSNWRDSWTSTIRADLPRVKHGYLRTFVDGLTETKFEGSRQLAYALDFVGHVFTEEVSAKDFIFPHSVLFVDTSFGANFDFANSQFGSDVDFTKATFSAMASFSGVTFFQPVVFREVSFHGLANFTNTTFRGFVEFVDLTFYAEAAFYRTHFSQSVWFSGAEFVGNAFFAETVFEKLCRFRQEPYFFKGTQSRETIFHDDVDFENVVFKNVGHFEWVRFANRVPSFLGVDNANTRLEFSDDSYFPKHDRTEDAVTRLGHLKRLADEHGQTDQALIFNALELHAKAGLPTTRSFTKLVTWVYGTVSDYGRSFTRPIATYAALLLITLLLATGHAAFSLSTKDCEGARWNVLSDLRRTTAPCLPASDDKLHLSGYRAAAEYTLYRAAGVLDFSDNDKSTDAVARRLFGQPIEPWWMRVWGVFKAIASTALLFLTALGLRNKYRIK